MENSNMLDEILATYSIISELTKEMAGRIKVKMSVRDYKELPLLVKSYVREVEPLKIGLTEQINMYAESRRKGS